MPNTRSSYTTDCPHGHSKKRRLDGNTTMKELQSKILEKVNLMDNGTLETLRNIRKVAAISFLLGQSLREPGPSTSSKKDEIQELRRHGIHKNYTSFKKNSTTVGC
ncbi:hypothetical protein Trydic_g14273 [Trypoxylus dichotomus]